jgi:hypothetical protein
MVEEDQEGRVETLGPIDVVTKNAWDNTNNTAVQNSELRVQPNTTRALELATSYKSRGAAMT